MLIWGWNKFWGLDCIQDPPFEMHCGCVTMHALLISLKQVR